MNHNAIAMVELARGIVSATIINGIRVSVPIETRLWVGLSRTVRESVHYCAPLWACDFIEEQLIPAIQKRFPEAIFTYSHPADEKSQTALDMVLAQAPVAARPAKSADEWAIAAVQEIVSAKRTCSVAAWDVSISFNGGYWLARIRQVEMAFGSVVTPDRIPPLEISAPTFAEAVRILLTSVRQHDRLRDEVRMLAGRILDREGTCAPT